MTWDVDASLNLKYTYTSAVKNSLNRSDRAPAYGFILRSTAQVPFL